MNARKVGDQFCGSVNFFTFHSVATVESIVGIRLTRGLVEDVLEMADREEKQSEQMK